VDDRKHETPFVDTASLSGFMKGLTMTKPPLPPGFSVLQLENQQWYPVRVERFFDPSFAEQGAIRLNFLPDLAGNEVHFKQRDEAVKECRMQAESDAYYEQLRWRTLAAHSNVYPERCAWYLDLLLSLTGVTPYVERWSGGVMLLLPCYLCRGCQEREESLMSEALTLDDALEELTQQIYGLHGACAEVSAKQKVS
jgi:hypothetical protein